MKSQESTDAVKSRVNALETSPSKGPSKQVPLYTKPGGKGGKGGFSRGK